MIDYSTILHDVFDAMERIDVRDIPDIARAFAEQEHEMTGTPTGDGEAKAALEAAFTAGMMAGRRAMSVRRWWDLMETSS